LLIDHTALIADEYERQGQEAVRAFFGPDHTHTSPAGAALNARLVVAGLRALEGHDFAQFLSEAGRAVEARRPAAADVRAQGRAPRRVGPVHAGFDPALPTVWLIGDSTVKNSWGVGADGLWGWGNPIAAYFDRSRINVENQALGGTSSRSFRTLGLWEEVRVQVKQGDHVIMQFGHNDGGGAQGGPGGRGSIRGNGEETVEVVLPATGEKEEVHTYGWYLRKTCEEVLAAGAIPIVCSPVPRNGWVDGKVRRASDDYAAWAREAAAAAGAQFIDLNSLIADRYDAMGEEAVKPLFPKDHTHTGWAGAVVNARCVFNGIRTLGDCGLKDFLLTDPEDPVEPPPSRPDMG
jgi:lysophospholipase L1-like esterase